MILRKPFIIIVSILILSIALYVVITQKRFFVNRQSLQRDQIVRIGCSFLTPLHCMFGEVFYHTDILKRHNIKGEIMFFEHGSDQARAFKDGSIDVSFSCEVPAILHLVNCPDLRVIGTPGELGRIALITNAQSDLYGTEQLRNKNVLIHDGSSAVMAARTWLDDSGIDPEGDVTLRCTGFDEIKREISDGRVDSAVSWDPWLEMLLKTYGARIIRERLFESVIVASEKFLQEYPEAAMQYKAALEEAFCWASNNAELVIEWISIRSGMDKDVIKKVLQLNNNWIPSRDETRRMDFSLTPHAIERLKESADFLSRSGKIPPEFNLEERLDSIFSGD